jgi:hypothetical protein
MYGFSLDINKCNKCVFLQTSNCRFASPVSVRRKFMRSKHLNPWDADGELRVSTAVSLEAFF